MREEVVTALIRGDEAEALAVVEPLDGTGIHENSLSKKIKAIPNGTREASRKGERTTNTAGGG
jgi:hypothetical protein